MNDGGWGEKLRRVDRGQLQVFISYTPRTGSTIAKRLKEGLERYRKPYLRPGPLRCYFDEENLVPGDGLTTQLKAAIEESSAFLLVSSEELGGFADLEAAHWRATNGDQGLVILQHHGTLVFDRILAGFDPRQTTGLPPSLLGDYEDEPAWLSRALYPFPADESDWVLENDSFRKIIRGITSAVTGIAPEELDSQNRRELERAMRFRRVTFTTIAVLAVGLAVAFGWAEAQRGRAEKLVGQMVSVREVIVERVRDDLATLPGAEEVAGDVLAQAEALEEALDLELEATELAVVAGVGSTLERARLDFAEGRDQIAVADLEAAIVEQRALLQDRPSAAVFRRNISDLLSVLGRGLRTMGDGGAALSRLEEAWAIGEALVARDGGSSADRMTAARAAGALAEQLLAQGELIAARTTQASGLELLSDIEDQPVERVRYYKAQAQRILGDCHRASGDLRPARAAYDAAISILLNLRRWNVLSTRIASDSVRSVESLVDVLLDQGELALAQSYMHLVAEFQSRMREQDDTVGNVLVQAQLQRSIAIVSHLRGNFKAARREVGKALAFVEQANSRSPGTPQVVSELKRINRVSVELRLAEGKVDGARTLARDSAQITVPRGLARRPLDRAWDEILIARTELALGADGDLRLVSRALENAADELSADRVDDQEHRAARFHFAAVDASRLLAMGRRGEASSRVREALTGGTGEIATRPSGWLERTSVLLCAESGLLAVDPSVAPGPPWSEVGCLFLELLEFGDEGRWRSGVDSRRSAVAIAKNLCRGR